jgi:hypothetical protein
VSISLERLLSLRATPVLYLRRGINRGVPSPSSECVGDLVVLTALRRRATELLSPPSPPSGLLPTGLLCFAPLSPTAAHASVAVPCPGAGEAEDLLRAPPSPSSSEEDEEGDRMREDGEIARFLLRIPRSVLPLVLVGGALPPAAVVCRICLSNPVRSCESD